MTHNELLKRISNKELTLIYWVMIDEKTKKGIVEVKRDNGKITQLEITEITDKQADDDDPFKPNRCPHCGSEL